MTSKSPLALLPLLLFLVLFVGSGLWYQSEGVDFAFYQISAPVAILPAIALAVLLAKGQFNQRIETFINGVGDNTIITMVLIYLLAGAFASVAKSIGGVDATVNLGLSIVPPSLLLPGLFVITAFVATSMGTSMGTIAAIAPIAIGVAEAADLPLLLTVGTVIGGAMFGDNLSIISDTTIAATRTQGCDMRDKFRMNFKIALPAALVTLVWLFFQSSNAQIADIQDYDLIRVLPYVVVLGLAIAGVNVMLVLFSGIILAGVIGLTMQADYTVASWSSDIYAGYTGMQEILILSLLIGGLAALMKSQGGLDWLVGSIERISRVLGAKAGSTRAGELSISAAVALTNLCTANNTVSILINGSVAKNIAERYNVDPRRSASLLDIFSCVVQGVLPYGAQILLASSLAAVSPFALIGYVQYSWLLAVAALISIVIAWPKGAK
ncbi:MULTISPECIES: Na+/H+ antiporter NhaC family protein [Marinomonas]|uniref:Na+/H+ antiporter NhaC family protein n=1 Tax=Marinomonas arctica TaxID=383750 RepID=A0A7H1J3Y1_9GAMM|nr:MULTISPECIES: Na+/H+ antiporter NhaC family protein [Marinomonas]MCS7486929.1 sodium:proton antiporter [Marinomonas sp. BSi20414]QNT05197.1 Na+/H+ antiporter NhaC family protein [Marinomonas arctica]GGN15350.1 sodium:proton antiporter [Marinomonas arctica]